VISQGTRTVELEDILFGREALREFHPGTESLLKMIAPETGRASF